MLIGILADSHGRHLMVRRALSLFDEKGVTFIIHCGDVGGRHVFDELVGRDCRFVWGNTDEPEPGLLTYLQSVGLTVPSSVPTRLELAGKSFAVFHGHEAAFPNDPVQLDTDYVLHGHTHVAADERMGRTRIINPGALYRSARLSVATLDPKLDKLDFYEIPKAAG